MNVYDFDDTIFDGDSSKDFFLFCARRHPGVLLRAPRVAAALLACKAGRLPKERLKEIYFGFVPRLPSLGAELAAYWESREKRIRPWYLAQRRADDVVISASPGFLLRPICQKLGVQSVIASEIEPETARFTGKNCLGAEKVPRFLAAFPDAAVENFYSDSRGDAPMARLARQAWLVKKDALLPWPQEDLL